MMIGSTQTNFAPRPYQNECVQAMLHYTGHAAITSLAVGLGKTKITTDFAREIVKRGGRVLLLAHREELVRNPVDNYLSDDIRCGIERGTEHARRDEPIISASVQSLSGARLKQYPHDYFTHICIDEAHHAVCNSYRKILDYFSGYQLFGTTATCHRYDGQALGQIFDDVLFVRDLRFGIENGYLCDIDCRRVQLQYDLGQVHIRKGDFVQAELEQTLSGTAESVAEVYERYAVGPTIIFCVSATEAQAAADCINRRNGPIASAILGTTKNRAALLQDFAAGKIKVLTSYQVLTEGVDTKNAQTAIIARPVARTNPGLYQQMVGRVLRTAPGKSRALIIDCTGISESCEICTAPTLLGLEYYVPPPASRNSKTRLLDIPLDTLTMDQIPSSWIRSQHTVDIWSHAMGVFTHGIAWEKLPDGCAFLDAGSSCFLVSQADPLGYVTLYENKTNHGKMPLQTALDTVCSICRTKLADERQFWSLRRKKRWAYDPATPAQIALLCSYMPGIAEDSLSCLSKADAQYCLQQLRYYHNKREGAY